MLRKTYRPAATTYGAVYFLLHGANTNQIDRDVVRSILQVLSLFPVGTLVELNDGRLARVVGTNEAAYTRPIVSVLRHANGTTCPHTILDLLQLDTLEIERIVPKEDGPDLEFLAGF